MDYLTDEASAVEMDWNWGSSGDFGFFLSNIYDMLTFFDLSYLFEALERLEWIVDMADCLFWLVKKFEIVYSIYSILSTHYYL